MTKLVAVATVATSITASASSAASLEFDGWTSGYQSVAVTAPGFSGAAGAFNMQDQATNDSFTVFCLDIIGVIYTNLTYDYAATSAPFASSADLISTGAVGRIQALFDSGYENALVNSVVSAGFQVALWNAVYDKDWTVDDGIFNQTNASSGVKAQANAFLAAAESYNGGSKFDLTYLEGQNTNLQIARSQNLVTAAPSVVPLPAGGLLLLTALGGLFVTRRRTAA